MTEPQTPETNPAGTGPAATESTGNEQKQSVKGVVGDIAGEALVGAVTKGGVPGAIAGAAKGAVKNKRARGWIISILAFLLIIQVAVPAALFTMVVVGMKEGYGNVSTQQALTSAIGSGVNDDEALAAVSAYSSTEIPWQIALAYSHEQDAELPTEQLTQALNAVDGERQYRNLDAGVYLAPSEGKRILAEDGTAKEAADKVKDTYVTALATLDGIDEAAAKQIYDTAMVWNLGTQSCTPSSQTPTTPESSGGAGESFDSLSDEQLANIATIIGVSKTALRDEDDAKLAATIAIATAMQESRIRAIDYGDEAGPDSRGIFQQRDPWGTLEVRMDPAGSTALFLQRLVKVPDWKTIPVTEAAQAVQISAHPDYYAQWEPLATAAVKTLWSTSDAVAIPFGITIDGAAEDATDTPTEDTTSGSTVCAGNGGGGSGVGITGPQNAKVTKWAQSILNTAIDEDGSPAGDIYQCFDTWLNFQKTFLGHMNNQSSYIYAKNIWHWFDSKGLAAYYVKINANAAVKAGDVVVFDANNALAGTGEAGHVAVAVADAKPGEDVQVIEQNANGHKFHTLGSYKRGAILGLIRLKGIDNDAEPTPTK